MAALSGMLGLAGFSTPSRAETGSVAVVFTKGGFIVGVGGGQGVLTLHGKHYPFTVSGMSVGFTIGASTTKFVGHALNTATYLTHDDHLGWLCFGGNVKDNHGVVTFTTLDSFRNRVFIAPLGLWLTLDAGHFSSVDYDSKNKTLKLHLAPQSDGVTVARLRVEQTANPPGALHYQAPASWKTDAGAYVLPLQTTETVAALQAK